MTVVRMLKMNLLELRHKDEKETKISVRMLPEIVPLEFFPC